VSTGGGAPGSAVAGSTATGAIAASGGSRPSVSEREAYQSAFDLMKGRQFEESIAAFNRLIVDYPNGQYTPNAFYWLGELHLAQQNTEQARQAFMQVVNLYPDHPKVPDTLYKLGVAYHRLGDNTRAMDYFNQVRSTYPQSSAAGLATSYAQEIR
jgi:tol-pal system protein YbgF